MRNINMKMSIYLDKKLDFELSCFEEYFGKSRNTIILEAINEWLQNHAIKKWHKIIYDFKGTEDFVSFEKSREELLICEDKNLFEQINIATSQKLKNMSRKNKLK